MFSQACVKNSVGGGGADTPSRDGTHSCFKNLFWLLENKSLVASDENFYAKKILSPCPFVSDFQKREVHVNCEYINPKTWREK